MRYSFPSWGSEEAVHRVIYEELCRGEIREASRRTYQSVVRQLAECGAQGVVLGCTEIPMLLQQEHSDVPLFDTADAACSLYRRMGTKLRALN